MKRALLPWLIAASCLATPCLAADVVFVTEDYPPFNYRDGNGYVGTSVEQIAELMPTVNLSYSLEMMPWARALSLAESAPNTCVFTTAHTPERDAKFKWVEPLYDSRVLLIRRTGWGANPATIDEAKAYVVGTERDDFTETILRNAQFPKIDLATDLDHTLKKLMGGRIDLMAVSESYFHTLVKRGLPVEEAIGLGHVVYALACNRSVPDATIDAMQTGLDRLIASGRQQAIITKYSKGQ